MNEQLQNFARAAGATYQGEGMGLHHFREETTSSNFCLRGMGGLAITAQMVLDRAQAVRRSFGKPEPVAESIRRQRHAVGRARWPGRSDRRRECDGPGHRPGPSAIALGRARDCGGQPAHRAYPAA